MSRTVCLAARTLHYLNGGGHFWAYLNWALGLRALGCAVIWLEAVDPSTPCHQLQAKVALLKSHLKPYGLPDAEGL